MLSLYRDVLRAARFLTWPNERGESWRLIVERSARDEFEAGKLVHEPEEIVRRLVAGRDALEQFVDRVVAEVHKKTDRPDS